MDAIHHELISRDLHTLPSSKIEIDASEKYLKDTFGDRLTAADRVRAADGLPLQLVIPLVKTDPVDKHANAFSKMSLMVVLEYLPRCQMKFLLVGGSQAAKYVLVKLMLHLKCLSRTKRGRQAPQIRQLKNGKKIWSLLRKS